MARRHLAIFLDGVSEKILDFEKQVEIRLSEEKVLPYGKVLKGDEIYIKDAGKKIVGKVLVDNCLYYNHLTPGMLAKIRKEYQDLSMLDDKFWQLKKKSRYASIIFLKNPQRFLVPVLFKKNDRRPWVIMEENI